MARAGTIHQTAPTCGFNFMVSYLKVDLILKIP